MLIVSRKRSQLIQIGENIVVKVLKTGKSTVKIGIEAPRDVRVLRGELCEPSQSDSEDRHREFPDEFDGIHAVACSDQFPQPHVA